MRLSNPTREVKSIGLMGEELPSFLNTLSKIYEPQFKGLQKALKMLIPAISGIETYVNDVGEVELRLREGNVLFSSRLISEGTLRILGLLAIGSMPDYPSLIGFEEPENGIHPRRIKQLAEYIKTQSSNMQMIITSHSPEFLDLIPKESLYICRKRESQTEISPFISEAGTLFDSSQIRKTLDDDSIDGDSIVSKFIKRGDFDV